MTFENFTENESQLLCPTCGSEYTHLIAGSIYGGRDEKNAGTKCAELTFVCEMGHLFSHALEQWKGLTISRKASSMYVNDILPFLEQARVPKNSEIFADVAATRMVTYNYYDEVRMAYIKGKGSFHRWGQGYIDAHERGFSGYTTAIIECEDGQVVAIPPETIKFLEPTKLPEKD